MLNGTKGNIEAGDNETIYLKNIRVFEVDYSSATKDINGEDLTYKGIDRERYLPSELGNTIDLNPYNATDEGVPTTYTQGDTFTNEYTVNDNDSRGVKKIDTASKNIASE